MENNFKENRIVLFLPTLLGGGAEETFVHLARYLASKNLKVYLIIGTKKTSNIYSFEDDNNINLIELNSDRLMFSFLKLYKKLKQIQPQKIFSTLWYANILIYPIAKNLKIPLVVREAGLDYRHENNFKSKLITQIIKYTYSRCDSIIAISNSMKDNLVNVVGIPDKKIHTIFNPVESYIDRNSLSKVNFERYFNDISQNTKYAVSACRLDKVKGLDLLVNSFSYIKDLDIRLLIIGEGAEKDHLKNLIVSLGLEEKIKILPWQKNVYDFIFSCDYYLSASINEGLGNAYLASHLLNKQNLCSNIPASLELNALFNKGVAFELKEIDISNKIRSVYSLSQTSSKVDINTIKKFTFQRCFESYLNLTNKKIRS